MKKIVYTLFLVVGISVFFITSCTCKDRHRVKYLTEDDKNWLPYKEGDSFCFFRNDTLIDKTEVLLREKGLLFNKALDGCKVEHTESLNIKFTSCPNIIDFHEVLKIGYDEDFLELGIYNRMEDFSPITGSYNITQAQDTNVSVGGNEYENARIVYNHGRNIEIIIVKNIGIIQFTNRHGETYLIKKL